jgi:hypothetical protein
MELLSSHWHCLLPIVVIGAGIFFITRDKNQK